jgi:hypothetical protein
VTPTARSLQALRKEGYTVAVVEKFNPGARVRQDLYGFGDILAVKADPPTILAIQATTVAHQAHRLTKLAGLPTVPIWLAAGGKVEVWGWAKRGPRGGRKRWECTRTVVTGEAPAVPDRREGEDGD